MGQKIALGLDREGAQGLFGDTVAVEGTLLHGISHDLILTAGGIFGRHAVDDLTLAGLLEILQAAAVKVIEGVEGNTSDDFSGLHKSLLFG